MANNPNPADQLLPNGLPTSPSSLVFHGNVCKLSDRFKYVSLNSLEDMDPTTSLTKSVFVGVVVYYKRLSADNKNGGKSIYSRSYQTPSSTGQFDKTMTIMCLNSPPGMNCCTVLLDGKKSDVVFGQHLIARDEKDGFSPGSVIALPRPSHVTAYFGSQDGIPILHANTGFRLVDVARSNIQLAQITHQPLAKRLSAAYYPKTKLSIRNCNVATTACCGHLCDALNMKKADGSSIRVCPCYKAIRNLGSLVLDVDFVVQVIDKDDTPTPADKGGTFFPINFTSRSFTSMVTKAGIRDGITTQTLEHLGADNEIIWSLETLLEKVNAKGGFSVLFWSRKGNTDDQAHDSAGTPGSARGDGKVTSSTAIVHPTKILFNSSRNDFKANLVDVNKIFADAVGNN